MLHRYMAIQVMAQLLVIMTFKFLMIAIRIKVVAVIFLNLIITVIMLIKVLISPYQDNGLDRPFE